MLTAKPELWSAKAANLWTRFISSTMFLLCKIQNMKITNYNITTYKNIQTSNVWNNKDLLPLDEVTEIGYEDTLQF